jgi:hypothetical protein
MDRDAALVELAPMASRLEALLAACPPERLRTRPRSEAFAPVEHLWPLADLETEAYGVRLRRRAGTQEKVGAVTLADLLALMAAHDLDHWRELRLALL